MQISKTLTINVTGLLTVDVEAPSRWYVDSSMGIIIRASGISVSGPWGVSVDWGDGTSTSEGFMLPPPWNLYHIYSSVGSYNITVTVTDLYTGATGSRTVTVQIGTPLTVSFEADKKSGNAPLTVKFTCSASGGFLNYSWKIDFGDGSTPASGIRTSEGTWTESHTYNNPGTYTATLTVEDSQTTQFRVALIDVATIGRAVIPIALGTALILLVK